MSKYSGGAPILRDALCLCGTHYVYAGRNEFMRDAMSLRFRRPAAADPPGKQEAGWLTIQAVPVKENGLGLD